MSELIAQVENPQGNAIAGYYETPNKEHDYEIKIVGDSERIKVILGSRASKQKIRNDVKTFLEANDHPDANSNISVKME